MPWTVSVDTLLFPSALDFTRDVHELRITAGIQSWFLRKAGISVHTAPRFAKQLHTAQVYTVGEFLHVSDTTLTTLGPDRLPYSCIARLDEYLQQFPDLPENQHAAPGIMVPTWLLRVVGATTLAHPTGVVCFCCAHHAIACTNVL